MSAPTGAEQQADPAITVTAARSRGAAASGLPVEAIERVDGPPEEAALAYGYRTDPSV